MVCKHKFSLFVTTVCSAAAVLLAGCGAAGSLPSVDPGTSAIGEIHGLNMGGHAPLAGSHIYLLEAGNSGYGSVAKSLISSSASGAVANGSWTNSGYNTDLFVPSVDAGGNTIYGLQADSGGGFTLTGDYTCDVGRVVYLVGVGGNPGSYGSPVTVTSVQVQSTQGSGASETATAQVLFNSSTSVSVGANLTFSGFSGSFQSATGINGTTSLVLSSVSGQSGVNIPDPNGAIAVGTYTVSGTATPSYYNHAAVNVAVLGTCPASGNFASSIPYIYLNEVSTVAAAYVLQPYVATSGTNQTGIDEFHIGSTSTALGLQGIQLAAANAANLYDITGTNAATKATHNALSVLPANSSGTVPQAELDTISNVLASCVDSGNFYRNGNGTLQASCQTLFQYASSNGVYDTSAGNSWTLSTSTDAFNTFQAAVNIARFPQGAGVGSTTSGTQTISSAFSISTASNYTSGLYALETGTVPFTPNLHSTSAGAPNAFTVIIAIADPTTDISNQASNLAVDGTGDVWMSSGGASNGAHVYKYSSSGAILFHDDNIAGGSSGPIAVDGSGNAWFTNPGNNTVTKISGSTGAVLFTLSGHGLSYPYGIAIDGSGNAWQANGAANAVTEFSSSGSSLLDVTSSNLSATRGLRIDGSGAAWVANLDNGNLDKFTSGGTNSVNVSIGSSLGTFLAIDGSGNIWTDNNGNIYKVSNSGTNLFNLNISSATGVAIDGYGNVWVSNNGGSPATSEFSNSGAKLLSFTGNGVPNDIVVDGSGNIWTLTGSGVLYEIVGAAAPVITPICAGLPSTPTSNGTSNLGTRP